MPHLDRNISKKQRIALRCGFYAISLVWLSLVAGLAAGPFLLTVYTMGSFPEKVRPYLVFAAYFVSVLVGWLLLWQWKRYWLTRLKAVMIWWYERVTKEQYADS